MLWVEKNLQKPRSRFIGNPQYINNMKNTYGTAKKYQTLVDKKVSDTFGTVNGGGARGSGGKPERR